MEFPIKNDIIFSWPILTDGEETSLDGRDLKLYINGGRVHMLMNPTIEGNVLTFCFYGKDQFRLGTYELELVENEGKVEMQTLRYPNAFKLIR